MPPKVTRDRYPKRKRAPVNYEIDLSIDGDLDLEDDGNVSEELGEDSQHGTVAIAEVEDEVDSEIEDATFGSRRIIKKRKVIAKPKKPKPPPKFKPFRLMNLPTELRLKVYEEALVDPHGVNIRAYWNSYENVPVHVHVRVNVNPGRYDWREPSCYIRGKWSKIPDGELPKKKYKLSPNLIAASKFVHNEAVSLLWAQPFIFANVSTLHSFLIMLRPETIARLRDITIISGGWNNNRSLPAFVLLRDAPLLQNLRLDCRIRTEVRIRSGLSRQAVIGEALAAKLYKDCYPFLKALVQSRGADAIRTVFRFNRDDLTKYIYDMATHTYVQDAWSQDREDKILEALAAELDSIMGRKIVPRVPRSHIF